MNFSFLHPSFFVLAVTACCRLIAQGEVKVDYPMLDRQLHAIITNKSTSDSDLLEAISRLGKVREPPEFWSRIANDPEYSLQHRRRAVFALFRRHCVSQHTFKELRAILKQARWLKESTIRRIEVVTGWIPILIEDGALYCISVLSPAGAGIYLRVSPEVDSALFSQLMLADEMATRTNPEIFQYGFDDDYERWLLNPEPP